MKARNVYDLNSTNHKELAKVFTDSFASGNMHCELINDSDERFCFFTEAFRRYYPVADINALNEKTIEQFMKETDIWPDFNLNSNKDFIETNLEPVYLPFYVHERNKDADIVPLGFIKVDLYTGDASLVIGSMSYNIIEETPEDVLQAHGYDFNDLRRQYENIDYFGSYEDYKREIAREEFYNDTEKLPVDDFMSVVPHILPVCEYKLTEPLRETILCNLKQNTKDDIIPKDVYTYYDFVMDLRDKAAQALLSQTRLQRWAHNEGVNIGTLFNNLKGEPAMDRNENTLTVSREGNSYIVSGSFKGTVGELCREIERISAAVQKDAEQPDLVLEFNDGERGAVVMSHKKAGGYFEIGVELPESFAQIENIDESKLHDILGIKGIPIAVEQKTPENYGSLAGKPAIFVVTQGYDKAAATRFAYDNVRIISQFDFDSIKDVSDICKDELDTDFLDMLTSSFNNDIEPEEELQ